MAPKAGEKVFAGVGIFNLIIHLSMLIVGALYRSEEDCKLNVRYMMNSI
jgi:hypothetical protein